MFLRQCPSIPKNNQYGNITDSFGMTLKVKLYGNSAIGKVRKNNQDSLFFSESAQAGVVADGVGGRNGGEVASNIVALEFAKFVQSNNDTLEVKLIPGAYTSLIEDINTKIYTFGENHKNMRGLGTTATALQFADNKVFIAHCGDSRAYLYARKHLFQLTIDHDISSGLEHGWVDPSNIPKNTRKSVLTRGVGLSKQVDVDIYQMEVESEQIYIVCSDGLSNMVDNKTIRKLIKMNRRTPEEIPKILIKEAYANGGKDNVTVLIAAVQ